MKNDINVTQNLEICSDCGKEVSVRAPLCPHCGSPRAQTISFSRFMKPDWGFEWRSETEIAGIPLVHIAFGRKNGKMRVAKGVIAIGQFAIGLFTIAQFGIGAVFGFGQFIFGATAIAQFAGGIIFGLGQFASGYAAIGQFAFGYYGLGQIALAKYSCAPGACDPAAKDFFLKLAGMLGFVK